jgi:ATP-binding cassette subfamily B protein/subfamily B ATP-binding cassette protein MsbA
MPPLTTWWKLPVLANAHNFIVELAEGYETVIGERGYRLSGGQRQRLSLARAILRNTEIMILDEATSNLDSESEKLIQDSLQKIQHERTMLIIAHRLSTIMKADKIIVLEKGRIVEQGTHTSLIAQRGRYANFWRLQSELQAI